MIRQSLESESTASGDETLILAFCEECGRATKFPATMRERVETCQHCGKYMDVIASEGASLGSDEIAASEYLSPSDRATRKFKTVFAILCVVSFSLIAVVRIIDWILEAWRGGVVTPQ